MKKKIKILGVDNGLWQYDGKPTLYYDILCKYYDVEISQQPDFLFYSVWGTEFLKYKNCVRIFHTGENVRPDFNLCDYAIGFDRIDFGERYIRRPGMAKRIPLNIHTDYTKRKFCNFIYSNDKIGVGAKLRVKFCKYLASYKRIDCPGKVMNNMTGAILGRYDNFVKGKYNFLPDYKFTIAWENEFYPGYSTEKIIHPLECNSIPIYMGDPDICLDYNYKSFINCNDFKTWDEILEYIRYLDENDSAYLDMLMQPPMNPDYHLPDIDSFLINIIENGKRYINDVIEKIVLTPLAHYRSIIECIKNYISCQTSLEENARVVSAFDSYLYKNYFNSVTTFTSSILPILKNIAGIRLKTEAITGFLSNGVMEGKRPALHYLEIIKSISARLDAGGGMAGVLFNINSAEYPKYLYALGMLWPYDVSDRTKIRMGEVGDGGCIMVLGKDIGVALSLGHKGRGGWEYELAAKGWSVWHYDNKLSAPIKPHPNISFRRIPQGESFGSGRNTLESILGQLGDVKRIIARVDIEGDELSLLENATETDLNRLEQFYVEFHGLSKPETLFRFLKILVRIQATHLPIHVHFHNNYGHVLAFKDFLFADLVEVTFARRDLGEFRASDDCYPSHLDSPNVPTLPDIYIGKFADATGLPRPLSVLKASTREIL